MENVPKKIRLNHEAVSKHSDLPAFISPPDGSPVYYGFEIVLESETDGWYYGAISDFLDPAGCTEGDAFVIAPDGTRAGLVWEVGNVGLKEIVGPNWDEPKRWGVYQIGFDRPVKTLEDLVFNFRRILPELKRKHDEIFGEIRRRRAAFDASIEGYYKRLESARLSHFTCIGFTISSPEELKSIVNSVVEKGESIQLRRGCYYLWQSGLFGAELWIHVDDLHMFTGMTPHFDGKSDLLVKSAREMSKSGSLSLGGFAKGLIEDKRLRSQRNREPFVFEMVDRGRYDPFQRLDDRSFAFPSISHVQLTALAYRVDFYETDDDYRMSQRGGLELLTEAFIPGATIHPDFSNTNRLESAASITGRVIEHRDLVNPFSNNKYRWILLKTLGGTVDVVVDQDGLNKSIADGGVISGTFWLTGKLLNPKVDIVKKSWLERVQDRDPNMPGPGDYS